ncbi:MAG: glycosyltransferase [Bdellovibrionales bacterium]|nr:glycosyltransferase [Bdellovibrionales bacterium]
MDTGKPRIGIVTTFNQKCGLATYADYLISALRDEEIIVLAETAGAEQLTAPDDSRVRRCWKRDTSSLTQLSEEIKRSEIEILHLNCHYRFFKAHVLTQFLSEQRAAGVQIIAHVHNPYTIDPSLIALMQGSDAIIVHTPENKLEAIANGAAPESVHVLEHGVLGIDQDPAQARQRQGIPSEQKVVVCFGFAQAHKGFDEAITAAAELKAKIPNLHLYIIGGAHHEDPNSVRYVAAIKELVAKLGAQSFITIRDEFASEELVNDFLCAADAVVMNYRSTYYEASGAIARALGCKAPVIASTAPTFARFADTVFHVTSGYPLPMALELVLSNQTLNSTLRSSAAAWAEKNSWPAVAEKLLVLYRQLAERRKSLLEEIKSRGASTAQPIMRVLMQNRSNALTHRGGDTVVMERVAEGLRAMNVHVEYDLDGTADVRAYDLVHIHNFATPQITEAFARRAHEAGVPYVVTTMYEDLPLFYNQMFAQFEVLQAYTNAGQPKRKWGELSQMAKNAQPSERWENTWTAEHAASLIATGERERQSLLRDYPNVRRVDLYSCGCNLEHIEPNGDLFTAETGLKDFIFCVGRLETRKNQLSLLKALDDSELTVVFATGGFTYQPEYEEQCKKFKRRGQTIFLDRLDARMLSSAFAAARVHALPSWYELPGIVSMEAARHNTNIVVTDYGTPKDYFGDSAYYCNPGDTESIYNAVMAAYYTPPKAGLMESVEHRTWENAAKQVLGVYKAVLSASPKLNRSSYELPEWSIDNSNKTLVRTIETASDTAAEASRTVSQIADKMRSLAPIRMPDAPDPTIICDEADVIAREGRFEEALSHYKAALEIDPRFGRAYRSCAVMYLQLGGTDQATVNFEQAIKFDATDARSIAGLGTCLWTLGQQQEGYKLYEQALERSPADSSILLQLLNAAYVLDEMASLENALIQYLTQKPGDFQIKYCLAGCCFKQQKFDECIKVLSNLLEDQPEHADALELKRLAEEKLGAAQPKAEVAQPAKPAGISQTFSHAFDQKLRELEKAKEARDYGRVIIEADEVSSDASARPDQRSFAIILKGESLACLERLTEAEELLQEVAVDRVHRARAQTALGAIAAARQDWDNAQRHFKDALNCQVDNDKALAGLGICAMKQGRLHDAWDFYQRSLTVNCENMRSLLGMVQVGYELNKAPEVQAALENYLDIHPADLAILYSYAGCLYAQGGLLDAKSELEKILIFDAGHAMANELLDKINEELAESAANP